MAWSLEMIQQKEIEICCGSIDTSQESKEVHPNTFCIGCYLTMQQMQANNEIVSITGSCFKT